ncbi:MAG: hypothetical protein WC795_02985 [Candidatus Paceibacterota bacterium]|jgi:hypothetical protein
MKKIKVVKLGTRCYDKATQLQGTLTHWMIGMGGQINYFFQPKGVDEEGRPIDRLYVEIERLNIKKEDFEEIEVPFEILGTTVTDDASGFTGMAISFVRHINGCFHVYIQPQGLQTKNNSPIQKHDFDLRGCSGEMIPKLSEKALEKSKKDQPSPTSDTFNTEPKLSSVNVEK